MQTKNILRKGLVIAIFVMGVFSFNMAKAQTDKLKDSVMALPADSGYDKTFTKCEHPSTFPGGLEGWKHFLETHLKYPKKALKHNTQGTVRVQLIVDKNGNVKDVKALNDPGDGLAEAAEKVIVESKYWIPAVQNGWRVDYRFVQNITFELQ